MAMYFCTGEERGDVFGVLAGELLEDAFEERELLVEFPFLRFFGLTMTSWEWLELLLGMRVTVGTGERCLEDARLFFSLPVCASHSLCFELPQLEQAGGGAILRI